MDRCPHDHRTSTSVTDWRRTCHGISALCVATRGKKCVYSTVYAAVQQRYFVCCGLPSVFLRPFYSIVLQFIREFSFYPTKDKRRRPTRRSAQAGTLLDVHVRSRSREIRCRLARSCLKSILYRPVQSLHRRVERHHGAFCFWFPKNTKRSKKVIYSARLMELHLTVTAAPGCDWK